MQIKIIWLSSLLFRAFTCDFMLFNSISFAVFLPVVFILYWFVFNKSLKTQNLLLLGASLFFYACWDWRFLGLLMFSIGLDYFTGLKICQTNNKKHKKAWLWLSVATNLGFLGFFKYYNFFATSFAALLNTWGLGMELWTLQLILPVGISFYTFHGLSYVFDIYNNRIAAEKNIIDYALFVSFFPLLVAGPIERATHLLPQIKQNRAFDNDKATDGLRQILWGLFKKIVIADNCAVFVNDIFANVSNYSGSTLVLGVVFFTIQVYGDFSGYSDIALGTARLFGIELLRNFNYPYFSRTIPELWKRWHISLSSWFRDYLYIPLGGNKGGRWQNIGNVFIIFLVSGFWHGANWTFLCWGLLHALYMLPSLFFGIQQRNLDIVEQEKLLPTWKEVFQIVRTMSLFTFSLIIFRSIDIATAFDYITKIFSTSLFTLPKFYAINHALPLLLLVVLFFLAEWIGREHHHTLIKVGKLQRRYLRWLIYTGLLLMIFYLGNFKENVFIYFQF